MTTEQARKQIAQRLKEYQAHLNDVTEMSKHSNGSINNTLGRIIRSDSTVVYDNNGNPISDIPMHGGSYQKPRTSYVFELKGDTLTLLKP